VISTLLLLSLALSLSSTGFWALVVASPLGKIPHKPFSCDTCLCGWGSIFGASAWIVHDGLAMGVVPLILTTFAATGLSRVTVALIEYLKAKTRPALDLPPPPVVQEEDDGE